MDSSFKKLHQQGEIINILEVENRKLRAQIEASREINSFIGAALCGATMLKLSPEETAKTAIDNVEALVKLLSSKRAKPNAAQAPQEEKVTKEEENVSA